MMVRPSPKIPKKERVWTETDFKKPCACSYGRRKNNTPCDLRRFFEEVFEQTIKSSKRSVRSSKKRTNPKEEVQRQAEWQSTGHKSSQVSQKVVAEICQSFEDRKRKDNCRARAFSLEIRPEGSCSINTGRAERHTSWLKTEADVFLNVNFLNSSSYLSHLSHWYTCCLGKMTASFAKKF